MSRRFAWAVAIGWTFTAVPAQAQKFGRGIHIFRPAPAAAPAGEKNPEVGNFAGSVTLPYDGDLRRKLEPIHRQLEAGQHVEAVIGLGGLSSDAAVGDFFLGFDPKQGTRRSFKSELRRLIGELPVEARDTYELQFGIAARKLLHSASERGDLSALQEVVRRYYYTQAGQESLALLADFHRLSGRPREAALCLERLSTFADADHPATPETLLWTAVCWSRAGETDKARQTLALLKKAHPDAKFRVGGREAMPLFSDESQSLAWLESAVGILAAAADPLTGDWLVFRGDAARNATVKAEIPFLTPRWYQAVSSDAQTMGHLESESQAKFSSQAPQLNSLFPLAHDNRVLMRTPRGVRVFDLDSGELLWQYPSDSNWSVGQDYWSNVAQASLSSDGHELYLVENTSSVAAAPRHRNRSPDEGPSVVASANYLVARAIDGDRQGNLRWEVGGAEGGDEPKLAGAFFLGQPLPYARRVYAIVEMKGAVRLVVLNAHSGRLEWSQDLAFVEQHAGEDVFRRFAGATPSIADDMVICPTSGGGVVAVDLTMQALSWAYLYQRSSETLPGQYQAMQPNAPGHGQHWTDGTATIAGSYVVLTPPESKEIHCLDLHTGKRLWTNPRNDQLYVACVLDGQVVVVGSTHVTALKLADGKPAWKAPLMLPTGTHPTGRGVATAKHYYLPLSDASVLEIDLTRGVSTAQSRSSRGLMPGNLICHRGAFISQGSTYLQVFDGLSTLRAQIDTDLRQNPHNVDSLRRRGELQLNGGEVGAAILTFREVYQLAPEPRHRDRLVVALFEGIRAQLPEHRQLSTELDELLAK